jgi:large subunit ribosomal protein L23
MGTKKIEDIIRRPIITEKSATAQQYQNAHIFEVDRSATKIQIKDAVQKLFDVKVQSVRTMVMPRKWKRYGKNVGRTQPWKKAVITLAEGQTIEVLEPK